MTHLIILYLFFFFILMYYATLFSFSWMYDSMLIENVCLPVCYGENNKFIEGLNQYFLLCKI